MMPRTRFVLIVLIAMTALPVVAADALPRVFFSPSERAAITATRRSTSGSNDAITVSVTSAATSAVPVDVLPKVRRLEGIVLARTGERFAWIGGKRYSEGAQFEQWQVRISAHGVALLRQGSRVRQLRVGEAVGAAATVADSSP